MKIIENVENENSPRLMARIWRIYGIIETISLLPLQIKRFPREKARLDGHKTRDFRHVTALPRLLHITQWMSRNNQLFLGIL